MGNDAVSNCNSEAVAPTPDTAMVGAWFWIHPCEVVKCEHSALDHSQITHSSPSDHDTVGPLENLQSLGQDQVADLVTLRSLLAGN